MIKASKYKQPWIGGASYDWWLILFPSFLALIIAVLLPQRYQTTSDMPLAGWVILVLMIDVAHVYSTLFRTYLDKKRFLEQKILLGIVPVLCYVCSVLLYALDDLLFWRVLAYLAVFHFIRQQYGIMRLYSRGESKKTLFARIDAIAVYAATIYPLIYWHTTPGRNFNWFIEGDFYLADFKLLNQLALVIYLLIVLAFVVKEVILARMGKYNIPRSLLIIGTFVSWYFGIIYFNGDLSFTLLNVVTHGIPYMALVWAFKKREAGEADAHQNNKSLFLNSVVYFIGLVLLFAYFEEGLWDGVVWREHESLFGAFSWLPKLTDGAILALVVPLLSLPQTTHYVLDGFIWKRKE